MIQDEDGKIGFGAHIVKRPSALNTEEAVWDLINALTELHYEGEPEKGKLPVLPINWVLITARRTSAVEPIRKPPPRKH